VNYTGTQEVTYTYEAPVQNNPTEVQDPTPGPTGTGQNSDPTKKPSEGGGSPNNNPSGNNGGGGGAPQGEQPTKPAKKQLSEIIKVTNLDNINCSDIDKPTEKEVLTAVKNKNAEVDLNQVEIEFDQKNLNKQATIKAKSDSSVYEGSVVVTYITQKDVAIQDGKKDIITGDIPTISTNNSTPRNNNVKNQNNGEKPFYKKIYFWVFSIITIQAVVITVVYTRIQKKKAIVSSFKKENKNKVERFKKSKLKK
ncbi:hypothetical protein, partial [Candidatus Phytoplasma pruni]